MMPAYVEDARALARAFPDLADALAPLGDPARAPTAEDYGAFYMALPPGHALLPWADACLRAIFHASRRNTFAVCLAQLDALEALKAALREGREAVTYLAPGPPCPEGPTAYFLEGVIDAPAIVALPAPHAHQAYGWDTDKQALTHVLPRRRTIHQAIAAMNDHPPTRARFGRVVLAPK